MGSLRLLIDFTLPPYYGPGVESAGNRNEYQGSSLRVKSAGKQSHIHVTNVRKSWEPLTPGALGAYLDLYRDSFTFTHLHTGRKDKARCF